MKNLPDPFPIRYAIHVKEHFSKDFPENIKKVLWNKLVIFLQNNELDFLNRTVKYGNVTFAFDKVQTAQLVELNKDSKWAEDLSEDLQKYFDVGTFSNGVGLAYSLGLISYKGMLEVPLFWKTLTNYENSIVKNLMNAEGYLFSARNVKEIDDTYNKIKRGDTGWLERNRTISRDEVFGLTIPYSKLWASLDCGQSKGVIGAMQNEAELDLDSKKVIQMIEDTPESIRVVCSKDLFSLMREEMLGVYKEASFCQNCNKILPFSDRSIKYCPNVLENKDCIRKRAAKRKKISSK